MKIRVLEKFFDKRLYMPGEVVDWDGDFKGIEHVAVRIEETPVATPSVSVPGFSPGAIPVTLDSMMASPPPVGIDGEDPLA